MRVLYCGDSPAGGPANYLLAILRRLRARLTHVPPGISLSLSAASAPYDAIIFSDYSKKNLSPAAERTILKGIRTGAGFAMVGGWGSFSGPFGGWRGTEIESVLPVTCSKRDDRTNFPGGASVAVRERHAMLAGLPFHQAPAICGLNHIKPRPGLLPLTERKSAMLLPLIRCCSFPAKKNSGPCYGPCTALVRRACGLGRRPSPLGGQGADRRGSGAGLYPVRFLVRTLASVLILPSEAGFRSSFSPAASIMKG